jgi:hypothetical protein
MATASDVVRTMSNPSRPMAALRSAIRCPPGLMAAELARFDADRLNHLLQVGERVFQRVANEDGRIQAGREIDIARQVSGDVFKDAEMGFAAVCHVIRQYSVPVDRSGIAARVLFP